MREQVNLGAPRPRSLTVSLLLSHLQMGGVERAILNLASGLVRARHKVHVVVANQGPLKSAIPSGVELIDLGGKRTRSTLVPLVRYLRRERPAALISSRSHTNLIAIAARWLSAPATKLIVIEHSRNHFEEATDWRNSLILAVASRLYKHSDAIVAVDQGVADACADRLGIDSKEVVVISNPVVTQELYEQLLDPAGHTWLNTDRPVFLAVGRLVPEKDFETLIRGYVEVNRRVGGHLVILGDGPLRSELGTLAKYLGIGHCVDLHGYVDKPIPYMRDADCFVLSSRTEGFPLVLVEALFAGTPCVATRCSNSVAEVLAEGQYGELVPVGDPLALAAAMIRGVTSDVPKTLALRRRAETYSASAAASQYLKLCGRLIDSG